MVIKVILAYVQRYLECQYLKTYILGGTCPSLMKSSHIPCTLKHFESLFWEATIFLETDCGGGVFFLRRNLRDGLGGGGGGGVGSFGGGGGGGVGSLGLGGGGGGGGRCSFI